MSIIDDWLHDRGNTHYPGCEKYHIRCAVAAEIALLTGARLEAESNSRHLAAEIARLTSERDEARELAVLAVINRAEIVDAGRSLMWIGLDEEAYSVACEGSTDAGILDALRRAKEASNGH